LPLVSNNNVAGTWSPDINNTVTTIYTFTPLSTILCADNATMTIVVNQKIDPYFGAIDAVCEGDPISPLPLVSNNNVTGTWSPSFNNLATTTYTFTPDSGLCANSTTLTVVVNPKITPVFTQVSPICEGESINSLPNISNNNIQGNWTPDINNEATTTYTFTPLSTILCADTATMTIVVNQKTDPIFTAVNPVCEGDLIAALPLVSNNNIAGTWSPEISNLATTTYTFTPDSGVCANSTTLTIVVNPKLIPLFTEIDPICEGELIGPLPTLSENTISGTWSQAINNNQTTTYTFTATPIDGVCFDSVSMTIVVNPKATPTFIPVAPICQDSLLPNLPTVSNNGITGTWSPAMNNTTTTNYTFLPTPGLCAEAVSMTVVVNPKVTPAFPDFGPLCYADESFALPLVSNNSISGTWLPVFDNTQTSTYIFTPYSGECAFVSSNEIQVYDDFDFEYKGYCMENEYYIQILPLNNSYNPEMASYNWEIDGQNVSSNRIFNISAYLNSTTVIEPFPIVFDIEVTTSNGCSKVKMIAIDGVFCGIQKGISVNDDNLNDSFDLSLLGVKQLKVFNRYGMEVYHKSNYSNEWKGQSNKGEKLPSGVYFYVIDFNDSENPSKTGWIYINRKE
jgi:gliding motility-associated-like protein